MRLLRFAALTAPLRLAALSAVCAAPLAAMGCSSSHTSGDDGGIVVMVDAEVLRPDTGPPPPMCGNGVLEGGEQCDDDNTADGDGCSSTCRREAYCGNGMVEPPEVCDDGNNRSADGCRSDCGSTEICGNGITDYATGEVCDAEPDCATDCRSLLSCGDGTVTAPETCDDMNMARWDGCGADCRDEVVLLMEDLAFADMSTGCDYSGDGRPDNRFARALGPAGALINMFLGGGGGGGGVTVLLAFLGLDDPAAVDDDSLRIGWLTGQRGAGGSYEIDEASLLPGTPGMPGGPATSIESTITSRMLDGGPEDLFLDVGFLPIELRQGRVRGTTTASGGELDGMSEGLVCGVVPASLFGGLSASILSMLGGAGGFMIDIGPPCDGTSDPSFADIFIGGATIVVPIRPTTPDVDLDGDGLETFIVDRDGESGCQPVVTACIDGDGTRIDGHDCLTDPRIADGYSAALDFTASRVTVSGTSGGGTPPPVP